MKITKYNRKKDVSGANNSATSSSFSYSSSGIVAQSLNKTPTLEKHTLWGQQFDGTTDVSGDITNAGNIEANGNITVNSSTDTEGKTIGGNIKADGNIVGKDISANNSVTSNGNILAYGDITSLGDINADCDITSLGEIRGQQITSNGNISASDDIEALGDIYATNAYISNNINTKNLTVTGSAHFFQLVIDKIRSIGGAFIASPADGFDVDVVEKVDGGYRLYWKQNDGSNERINQWVSGDQALCMNMNGAKVGTSHTIQNKYYWALVVSTNIGTNPIDKLSDGTTYIDSDHNLYNYIQISSTDCDGTVNPEIGDTIVQLGSRNDKESNPNYRGSAEYIATYNSLDSELTPPLLAQYRHIGSVSGHYYDLKYYRKSYFDAKSAKFVGNFEVNSGQSVEDYIADSITTVNNKISKVEETANGIKTTVSDVSSLVDNLNGSYSTLSNKVTEIETTADGISTQVSKYINPSKNYFGFCKNLNWETMGTNVIPFISKYGVEIHKNDSKVGRISNLGFEGKGGMFVVSGNIYMKNTNKTIHINLGDKDPYKIEFANGYSGKRLNVTTNETPFVLYFELSDNDYTSVESGYNGFLDFEGVDDDNTCIVTNLKIERGVLPTAFCIADEDRDCEYKVIKQYGDWKTTAISKDNDSKSYTITTKPTEGNGNYIDYVYLNNINLKDKQCYTLSFEADCDTENVKILSFLYGNGGIINSRGVYENYGDGNRVTKLTKGKKKYYVYWYVYSAELTDFKPIKNCIPFRIYYSAEVAKANIKFSNVTLYEGYVSDSVYQTKTYSKISQTADSITSTVVGSNVIAGIGNGNYWNGYTSFDENGYTFTFKSSNYLVSPVFADYSGTYTLLFISWTGTIKVEIFQFTTMYKLTDNPSFSDGTLIASISTKDVDNYDDTKMHYSNVLHRYYFTIKETTGAAKAFRLRFSTTDSINYIQKVQIEDGSVPHKFNESYAYNQSQIKQTADAIELKVNDVSLKLSDGIELNGDTKVNGSVTIKDEDTGFLLMGNSGTTLISPKSIGTYSDFYNKAENSNTLTGSVISFSDYGNYNVVNITWNFTRSMGIIPSGKTVKFTNATIAFMKPNSGTVLAGINISFKIDIYEGDNKIKSLSSTSQSMNLANESYISNGGEFELKFAISANFDKSYWANDNNGQYQSLESALCNWGFVFEYPNGNFQLIGFDGHALNFGNNSVVYFGPLASVLKYGDYALKISTDGIQRYNSSYKLGSSKKTHIHGSQTYTDAVASRYISEYVPINGYNIRLTYSEAGNVFIDVNDDVLEIRNTDGTVNVFLGDPYYFVGKRILIKKTTNGGDMDVYAGYSTNLSTYSIIRSNTASTVTKYTDNQYHCRAYFSDGTNWIEEWLSW